MPSKFSEEDRDCRVVDVNGLINDLKGGTGFSFDQIILQLSTAEDNGDDFNLIHGETNQRYRVPLGHIRKFFEEYEKPTRPMTPEQEVIFLRKKLEEKEAQVADLTGIVKEEAKGAMLDDILKGRATPDDIKATFDSSQMQKVSIPKARPAPLEIPHSTPEVKPEKESVESIQARLKAELGSTRPTDTRAAAAKGINVAERSPSEPDTAL